MKHFLEERDYKAIGNVLKMLHENKKDSPYHNFMPPVVGTPEEILDLQIYLAALNPPPNKGAVASR